MEKSEIEHFKKKLLEEKARLTKELETVGRINPDNPDDWQPVPGEFSTDTSDKNDYADTIEQFEENTAILKQLETEFIEVVDALKRIEAGTYGICENTGEAISKERLEAYPAARTCN